MSKRLSFTHTILKFLIAFFTVTACTTGYAISQCQYSNEDYAIKCIMTAAEMQRGSWKKLTNAANKNHYVNQYNAAFYVYYNYQLTPDNKENPNHVDYNDVKDLLINLHTNHGTITCKSSQVIIGECYGYGKLDQISFEHASASLLERLPMGFNIG